MVSEQHCARSAEEGPATTVHCAKHRSELADEICDHCGDPFCETCLVWPRGDRHPPLCIPCAMARAGVRGSAGAKPIVRREVQRRRSVLEQVKARRAQHARGPVLPPLRRVSDLPSSTPPPVVQWPVDARPAPARPAAAPPSGLPAPDPRTRIA
jgi:hypothetical protein